MHEMTVNNDFKSPNVSILYLGIMLSKRPSPVVRAKTWCETVAGGQAWFQLTA